MSEPTATSPRDLYQTDQFRDWFAGLNDRAVRAAVRTRLLRLSLGNAGDAAPIGDGVSELRIHLGAGWRVYYIQRGTSVFILLAGGSKRTQANDIKRAKALAAGGLELVEAQIWPNA